MISKILVPHDGTEMSDRAFKKAVELAKVFKAELVLLHVIEEIPVPPIIHYGIDIDVINRAKKSTWRELEKGWNKVVEVKTHEIESDNVDLTGECKYGSASRADPALRKKQQNRHDSNGKSQIERDLEDKGSWQCDQKSVGER